MKILTLTFILFMISFKTLASEKRVELFDCAYLANSPLERVIISEVTLGRKTHHQFELHSIVAGFERVKTIKVNLLRLHNDNIFHFTNGNTRIKIDFVQKKSFGRIPDFDIHSYDWYCKPKGMPYF